MPPIGFSPATNTVTIRVADDGSPPLSDAKIFTIAVVSAPRILTITEAADGTITLVWQAFPGKTYRVQSTTDLASGSWSTLGADVTATGSTARATDDASGNAQRFYRVNQLN
jgi:hypothetical protein